VHPQRPHVRSAIAATVFAALLASVAHAQDRTPAEKKQMLDLAYVLGEAHALKQACAPDDQSWR
jgi:predicted secreted protein